MPTPADTIISTVTAHVHEVTTRTPDWFDWLTIFLPVVIPVLTFFLGYKLNEWVEERKEINRLKEVKEYFLVLAEHLAETLDIQAVEINNTISKIENMSEFSVSSPIFVELNTSRIRSISYLDQYKIFVPDKNNISTSLKRLNTISASLDFIDAMKERIQGINNELLVQRVAYDKAYAKNALAMSEINTNLYISTKTPLTDGEAELYNLNQIYVQCTNEYGAKVLEGALDRKDSTKKYEEFIKPLYDKTRVITESIETITFLKHIKALYNNYNELLVAKSNAIRSFQGLLIDCDLIANNMRIIRSRI